MKYNKATIYFLSGTGNTYRAATWAAESAIQKGAEARVVPVSSANPADEINDSEGSLVGLFTPTHGFTAPWLMIKFAFRLPRAKNAHAIVLSTRASIKLGRLITPGISGSCAFLLALILILRGYKVRGVMSLDMPSNWISFHPGLKPENAEAIVERARPKAERFMERILSGEKHWLTWNNLYEIIWMVLLTWISLGYLLIGRFFLAKIFFANFNCNGCGLCAKYCPVGAIMMWGKKKPWPFWSYHCESCMRCMSFCPKQAVEAGHSWAVILYYVTSVPAAAYVLSLLAGYVPFLSGLHGPWADYGLYLIYFYPALFISYYVFYLLVRLPLANRIFTYTTFTHIYRRYHEPETKVKAMVRPNETEESFQRK